jgi:dTDP-4-dehydrorhamnose 3,5-epimerase
MDREFKRGQIQGVVVRTIRKYIDERGWLAETFRHDELEKPFHPEMAYISVSLPGVQRGPHEHVDQADYFVFLGPGNFKIWMWDNRKGSSTYWNRQVIYGGQDNPISVLVPAGVVHAYRNVSEGCSTVLNFPNRLFMGDGKKSPIDEIRHEDDPHTIFKAE